MNYSRHDLQALVAEHGSISAAARAVGVPRETFRDRLNAGESTLYEVKGPDGTPKLQWVKLPSQRQTEERKELEAALQEAFASWKGQSIPTPAPTHTDKTRAVVYMLADHHLGMYAWAKEAGEDYDVAIADKLLREASAALFADTPDTETGVILNLGDFFHADNNRGETERSGNRLDTDSRHAKVLMTGVSLLIDMIERAKAKHAKVIVKNLPGNHDPYASLALTVALASYYANDPRVTIDVSPEPFWWWSFGASFIAAHHGHMVKPKDFPAVMASLQPGMWGKATFRYAYFGHVHHASIGGGEHGGVEWRTFQTLAPKDAWHRSMGYSSGRSISALVFDKKKGFKYEIREPVLS